MQGAECRAQTTPNECVCTHVMEASGTTKSCLSCSPWTAKTWGEGQQLFKQHKAELQISGTRVVKFALCEWFL